MDALIQDLRLAVRRLLQRRMFAVVAVLTLGTGIGATTAAFSVVDAVLLRPLPYRDPSRLYRVWQAFADWRQNAALSASWDRVGVSFPQYLAIRDAGDLTETAAVYLARTATITGAGDAEHALIAQATATLLPTLGVQPAIGRSLSEADEAGSGADVVVLSYGFWKRRFGGEPGVLGRTIRIDGRLREIVGVMPVDLRVLGKAGLADTRFSMPEAWIPIGVASPMTRGGFGHGYQAIVRLKGGADPRALEAKLVTLLGDAWATYRPGQPRPGGRLEPLGRYETLNARTGLWLLLAGAGIVLVVACGNVANLMLSELAPRSRELAVRAGLGAGRARIARMLLVESVLVALGGGALGLALSRWGIAGLVALAPAGTPNIDTVEIGWRVFAFSLALTVGTGVLFGLIPAWVGAGQDVVGNLKQSQPTMGRAGGHLQRLLCAGQVALAVVAVVSGALLAQSLARLSRVDPAFRTDRLLAIGVSLRAQRERTPASAAAFYSELRVRLSTLPGVRSVTQTSAAPFRAVPLSSNPVWADGVTDARKVEAERRFVLPNFFEVMGLRVADGDVPAAVPPAGVCRVLVSRTLARALWPDGRAVGSRLQGVQRTERTNADEACPVVGIVEDIKERTLAGPPLPTYYKIDSLSGYASVEFILRTDGDPNALIAPARKIVSAIDPEVVVLQPRSMDGLIADTLAVDRYRTVPIALFALVAAFLAGIGTYGVTAQFVARDVRALGIRLALGARPVQMLRFVLRHVAATALAGLAAGGLAALAVSRLLRSFLFGVEATDVATFAGATIVLMLVMLAAGFVPARRAARLDPARVLRAE